MAEERDRDKEIWGELTTSRARVADIVFAHLARAILRGKIQPGETLPAERDLAERYDVSRVLVREAVHKLKELGLVRVKQGGQTTVLDPALASDPRIMSLEIELDGATPEARRDLKEKLLMHAVALLEVSSGRLHKTTHDQLDQIADELAGATDAHREDAMNQWWMLLAIETKNAIFLRETRFWLDLASRAGAISCLWRIEDRDGHALYKKLAARLRKGEDAAATLLRAIRPSLDR